MNRICFIIFVLTTCCTSAQSPYRLVTEDSIVVELYAEQLPEFPGGDSGLAKFIEEKLEYSSNKTDFKVAAAVVNASFVIEKTGKVGDITINQGVIESPLVDKAVVRSLDQMTKWKPAKKNGQAVDFYYSISLALQFDAKNNKVTVSLTNLSRAENMRKFGDDAYNNGVKKLEEKDFGGAIEQFTIAINLNPSDIDALFNRASAKLNLNDTAGACEDWNSIRALGRNDADEVLKKFCGE